MIFSITLADGRILTIKASSLADVQRAFKDARSIVDVSSAGRSPEVISQMTSVDSSGRLRQAGNARELTLDQAFNLQGGGSIDGGSIDGSSIPPITTFAGEVPQLPGQFQGLPEASAPQAAFRNYAQSQGLPTGIGGGVLGNVAQGRFTGANASLLSDLAVRGIQDPQDIGAEFSAFMKGLNTGGVSDGRSFGVNPGPLGSLETSSRSLSNFNKLLAMSNMNGEDAAQTGFTTPYTAAQFSQGANLGLDAARQRYGGFASQLLPGADQLTGDFQQGLQSGQLGPSGYLDFLQKTLGLSV